MNIPKLIGLYDNAIDQLDKYADGDPEGLSGCNDKFNEESRTWDKIPDHPDFFDDQSWLTAIEKDDKAMRVRLAILQIEEFFGSLKNCRKAQFPSVGYRKWLRLIAVSRGLQETDKKVDLLADELADWFENQVKQLSAKSDKKIGRKQKVKANSWKFKALKLKKDNPNLADNQIAKLCDVSPPALCKFVEFRILKQQLVVDQQKGFINADGQVDGYQG